MRRSVLGFSPTSPFPWVLTLATSVGAVAVVVVGAVGAVVVVVVAVVLVVRLSFATKPSPFPSVSASWVVSNCTSLRRAQAGNALIDNGEVVVDIVESET